MSESVEYSSLLHFFVFSPVLLVLHIFLENLDPSLFFALLTTLSSFFFLGYFSPCCSTSASPPPIPKLNFLSARSFAF